MNTCLRGSGDRPRSAKCDPELGDPNESVRRRRGLGRLGRAAGEPLLDVPGGRGGARAVGGAHHGLLAPAQQPAEGPETGGDRGPHLVGAPGHPARRQRGVHGRRVDGHGARRDVDDQVLLAAAGGQ